MFILTGGIAFLTLVVNGPTAGPLLKKLGLVTPTRSRDKVLENYEGHMKQNTLVEYLKILANPRFGDKIDYAFIRRNVSPLRSVTENQLTNALASLKKKHPGINPTLKNLLPYLVAPERTGKALSAAVDVRHSTHDSRPPRTLQQTEYNPVEKSDEDVTNELRRIFIAILRAQYRHQIETGELESRGFVPHALLHGLEKADDAAQENGTPLGTWSLAQGWSAYGKAGERALRWARRVKSDASFVGAQYTVRQAIAHIHAHEAAARIFKEEFSQVRRGAPVSLSSVRARRARSDSRPYPPTCPSLLDFFSLKRNCPCRLALSC
jgi:hypothetical protein